MPNHPVVTDDDVLLRCAPREVIQAEGLGFRVVWGMLYSPSTDRWLAQWRRADKYICPSLWDMSCAGHVDCLDGRVETYAEAYARELREELGLEARLMTLPELRAAMHGDLRGAAPTTDLGYARAFDCFPIRGGGARLIKEHTHRFLSLYEGDVRLPPDGEPQALAWMTADEIRQQLGERGLATGGLLEMVAQCQTALAH
jgi:8-oxo-dGTP pyrophosphatase MutT (NUDIX family)